MLCGMPILIQNNSHAARGIRRSPASHCCHVRRATCTRVAHSVCVSRALNRQPKISSGLGKMGPFGPRFGWFVISESGSLCAALFVPTASDFGQVFFVCAQRAAHSAAALANLTAQCSGLAVEVGKHVTTLVLTEKRNAADVSCVDCNFCHFLLQPLNPEARLWRIHKLNNTLIERNVKNFSQQIFEAAISPHNLNTTTP